MVIKKMKKKIMNVCGVFFLAISLLACSGQKKGAEVTAVSYTHLPGRSRVLSKKV